MSDAFRVETRSVDGGPTALGWAGSVSVVVDRPVAAGGRGLGFNGGQLLDLAVAGCISSDLFREAASRSHHAHAGARDRGERLYRAAGRVDAHRVRRRGRGRRRRGGACRAGGPRDRIAEIPNSIRNGTPVTLRAGA